MSKHSLIQFPSPSVLVELQSYSWRGPPPCWPCPHSPCLSSCRHRGQSPTRSPKLQRDPSLNQEGTRENCRHLGMILWPLGRTGYCHGDHHRHRVQDRPGRLGPREMLTEQLACSWRLFQRERETEREREREREREKGEGERKHESVWSVKVCMSACIFNLECVGVCNSLHSQLRMSA